MLCRDGKESRALHRDLCSWTAVLCSSRLAPFPVPLLKALRTQAWCRWSCRQTGFQYPVAVLLSFTGCTAEQSPLQLSSGWPPLSPLPIQRESLLKESAIVFIAGPWLVLSFCIGWILGECPVESNELLSEAPSWTDACYIVSASDRQPRFLPSFHLGST